MSRLTESKLNEVLEKFLKKFKSKSAEPTYRVRISQMIASDNKSLIVDHEDFMMYDIELANMMISDPDTFFDSFTKAIYEILRIENPSYAESLRRDDLNVRIRNLPDKLSLRNISTKDLDKLIAAAGIIVRTSDVKPLAVEVAFKCVKCGHVNREPQDKMILKRPRRCEECEETRNFELLKKNRYLSISKF